MLIDERKEDHETNNSLKIIYNRSILILDESEIKKTKNPRKISNLSKNCHFFCAKDCRAFKP